MGVDKPLQDKDKQPFEPGIVRCVFDEVVPWCFIYPCCMDSVVAQMRVHNSCNGCMPALQRPEIRFTAHPKRGNDLIADDVDLVPHSRPFLIFQSAKNGGLVSISSLFTSVKTCVVSPVATPC